MFYIILLYFYFNFYFYFQSGDVTLTIVFFCQSACPTKTPQSWHRLWGPTDSRSWLHRWNAVPVFTRVCPLAWSNFFSVSAFSVEYFLLLSCFVGGASRGGRGGFPWFLSSILYSVWLSFSQCFADDKGSCAARHFGGVAGEWREGDGRRKGWAKLSQRTRPLGPSDSDWLDSLQASSR